MFVYVLTELTADGILSTFEICRTQIHYQDKHSDSDTLNRFVGAVLWPHGGTTSRVDTLFSTLGLHRAIGRKC